MDDVIAKAKDELLLIDQEIRRLHARKVKLQQFMRTYSELFDSKLEDHLVPDDKDESDKKRPAKAIILDAVENILSDDNPRHTRILLDMLRMRGIEVGGKDKVLALSALLSRDDRFESDRKVGWSLKSSNEAMSGAGGTAPDIFN